MTGRQCREEESLEEKCERDEATVLLEVGNDEKMYAWVPAFHIPHAIIEHAGEPAVRSARLAPQPCGRRTRYFPFQTFLQIALSAVYVPRLLIVRSPGIYISIPAPMFRRVAASSLTSIVSTSKMVSSSSNLPPISGDT